MDKKWPRLPGSNPDGGAGRYTGSGKYKGAGRYGTAAALTGAAAAGYITGALIYCSIECNPCAE